MLDSHKSFINSLQTFRFAADFYETLIGISSIDELSDSAANFLISNIPNASVAIVFADSTLPQLHFYGSNPELEDASEMLSNSLTGNLAKEVCRSNQICTESELLEMGIAASPVIMKKISIAAIGFSNTAAAKGMVVLYRDSDHPLIPDELTRAASVMHGFAKAVRFCEHKTSWQSTL